MKVSTALLLSLALSLTVRPLFAAEGILIVQKNTIGAQVRNNQVQIEKDRMRTEIEAGTGGTKQMILFDGPKQVLTIVYPDRKTYSELTKADADKLGVQVSPELKAQMEKMPPQQRAMVEAMMRGRGAAPPPAKMEYRRAGSDKVGKWTCDKYDGYQLNVKKMEICTVAPSALGVTMSDFDITKQMAAFFAKITPTAQAGGAFEVGTPETTGFSGIPVRSLGFGSKGEVIFTSEIVDVRRQSFPASSYDVPAGFQKQPLFGGGGRGPR